MDWGHEVLLKENHCADAFFKGETGNLAHDVVTGKAEDLKTSASWGVCEARAAESPSLLLGRAQTTTAVKVHVCILSNYFNCRDHSPSLNCQLVYVPQLLNSISLIHERAALLYQCNVLAAYAQLNFS